MNIEIDEIISKAKRFSSELFLLREIIIGCGLIEEVKWKQACFTFDRKNVVIIGEFKEYCAIMFFKGSLLADSKNILITPTENSQSGRQIRFTSVKEILDNEENIKHYIFEAIEVEKAGLKINYKSVDEFEIPQELKVKFENDKSFQKAFKSLTPGRQKGYMLHFSQATQTKTREARIEKYYERIMNCKGITDCVCGLSKRMPSCDGSHKKS